MRLLRRIGRRLTYANVMATIAAFAALGGGAYAAGHALVGGDGVVHGCVDKTGVLHVVAAGRHCARKQTAISFNQKGPQGPAGASGAPGVPGSPGSSGAPATRYWAKVKSDGTLAAASGAGISSAYNSGSLAVFVTFPASINLTSCAVSLTTTAVLKPDSIDGYPNPGGSGNNVLAVESYDHTGTKVTGTVNEPPFDVIVVC